MINSLCKDLEIRKKIIDELDEYSNDNLAKKYNCSSRYIGDIWNHRRRTSLTNKYNF